VWPKPIEQCTTYKEDEWKWIAISCITSGKILFTWNWAEWALCTWT
jgi:hypothetical protein